MWASGNPVTPGREPLGLDGMSLHELVAPYEFLIGTWQGQGRGHYPTIDSFEYTETLTFSAVPGKPFLRYEQKTASPDGGPMHTEVGYFRPRESGHIEFVLAQPMGQTELLEGTATDHDDGSMTIVLGYSQVVNTTSAKLVESTARHYVFNPERTMVHHEFDLAAVGEQLQNHLVADLHKIV